MNLGTNIHGNSSGGPPSVRRCILSEGVGGQAPWDVVHDYQKDRRMLPLTQPYVVNNIGFMKLVLMGELLLTHLCRLSNKVFAGLEAEIE